MEDYIQIGKIATSHGLNGEILLTHSLGKKADFKNVKAIFLEESKGKYLPWFVQNGKARTDEESIVKLEGIDSKESSKRILHKKVWLRRSDFEANTAPNAAISLLGYMVYNEEEPLSKVEEVIEQPHQVLLQITYKGKEMLLPLHEETLDGIDRDNKSVYLTLPDGLLEVYLEG